MQPRGGVGSWIRTYLVLGILWCFITNVHAAVTGAPGALVAASGPSTGVAKALDVARVLAGQVGLWPLDVWNKVLRPIFG
jgi:hypothetical protein